MGVGVVEDTRERVLHVVETFGPTIQGEGPDAGRRCYFLRLGGCDYRCSWCDSMYAVDPELVRLASRKRAADVVSDLVALGMSANDLLVISGGNPALHRCDALLDALHERLVKVSVETQGSVWRPWLGRVHRLVVSPKPPSSGMATPQREVETLSFLDVATPLQATCGGVLKMVVFDEVDLDWAIRLARRFPMWPLYLSAGTDRPDDFNSHGQTLMGVSTRYRWLCEEVVKRRVNAVVLPQLHVIAWGHSRGV